MKTRLSRSRLWAFLAAIPKQVILLFFSLVAIYPIYYMIVTAFKNRPDWLHNQFGLPNPFTLQNITDALNKGNIPLWFVNSLIVTTASLIVSTIVSALAAYALARFRFSGRAFYFNSMIALMVIPPAVLILPLFVLMACVITETTQSEAGLIPPEDGFMFGLRKRCSETGALLVIDDVQMGLGRTGSLFSFEHYGIVPDILVLAKALGAGLPLGAFIASKPVMDTLAFDPQLGHITTFGGHPLSCAASLAGLEVLLQPGLIGQAEEKGRIIEEMLAPALQNGIISSIRRKGLALGIDLADASKRKALLDACLQQGVLTDYYLFKHAAFRIAPPLVISREEINEGMDRLLKALASI